MLTNEGARFKTTGQWESDIYNPSINEASVTSVVLLNDLRNLSETFAFLHVLTENIYITSRTMILFDLNLGQNVALMLILQNRIQALK